MNTTSTRWSRLSHVNNIYSCYNVMTWLWTSIVFVPKMHHPHLILRKTSNSPLKNTLKTHLTSTPHSQDNQKQGKLEKFQNLRRCDGYIQAESRMGSWHGEWTSETKDVSEVGIIVSNNISSKQKVHLAKQSKEYLTVSIRGTQNAVWTQVWKNE